MATDPSTTALRLRAGTRIYLAGHTGLVGGAILRALDEHGYENLLLRTHAELDLTDQAQTKAFFAQERPEMVILAAARVGGIMANWEHPYEFVHENLAIELNVIHEAFRTGVKRLIFLGSSCIYPRLAPQPLKEEYLLTGPLEETNRPYAIAKIAGIELCRSLNREYGTRYLSLMPTNLYGPGDNFDLQTSHLVPALIRKFHEAKVGVEAPQVASAGSGSRTGSHSSSGASAGVGPAAGVPPVVLWGTGTPRRELLHVDDLAAAVLMLLETGDELDIPDGLINIGTGEDATIAELAAIVQRVVGHDGEIIWDTDKPDGTPQKLLDVGRIRGLGWAPRFSLEEGLKHTYKWFLGSGMIRRGGGGDAQV